MKIQGELLSSSLVFKRRRFPANALERRHVLSKAEGFLEKETAQPDGSASRRRTRYNGKLPSSVVAKSQKANPAR